MVLLIEDHEGVRMAATALLEDAGHVVVAVDNAKQALDLIDDPALELIITDINLPDMSGMDLLRAVRKQRPEVPPVIILTAVLNDDDAIEARRLGVHHYLLKHRLNWPYFPTIVKTAIAGTPGWSP